MAPRLDQKLAVEFIGTFFLVLTIGTSVLNGASTPPLAIGSVLAVLVYAGGHISGAHYNPAVTLSLVVSGAATAYDLIPYWIAQTSGAVVAAVIAQVISGKSGNAELLGASQLVPAFLAEFLFTFLLAYVVHNVATLKKCNEFYGFAIGFTVLSGAFAVGSISGGAFNPAVAIGAGVLGLINPLGIGLHIVADLAVRCAAAADRGPAARRARDLGRLTAATRRIPKSRTVWQFISFGKCVARFDRFLKPEAVRARRLGRRRRRRAGRLRGRGDLPLRPRPHRRPGHQDRLSV